MADGTRLQEDSLRELEKKVTCGVCHEQYTDPKCFPCGHSFCKRCILKLVRNGRFCCPECDEEVALPEGGVDQLGDPPADMEHSTLKFCEDEKAEILGNASCDTCTLGKKAVKYCQTCHKLVCDVCVKAHRRMKAFVSHQLLTFDELKGEGAKNLLNKKSSAEICQTHGKSHIAFCFDCKEATCHDCIVTGHRAHNFGFNRCASSISRQELLKELERVKMVEEFMSRVQGNENFVDAHEDVWMDIQNSFKELHDILENRKLELLEEVRRMDGEKRDNLSDQERKLAEASRIIHGLIQETEEWVNGGSDEAVMSSHVDLLKRIELSAEDCKRDLVLEPVEDNDIKVEVECAESLQKLCNDEVKIIYLQVDPAKCTVLFEEDQPARVNWKSEAVLTVRLTNDRAARSACKIDCRLASSSDGSSIPCDVEQAGGGVYYIQYTPTTNKCHELTVLVDDENVPGSPFTMFVYVAPVPEDQGKEEKSFPMQTSFEYEEETSDESWTWEEHGLELQFQDEVPADIPQKRVEISAAPEGEFELPDNTKLASVAFLVQCPFDLKKEVEMKIPHFASETSTNDYDLSFVVSKDITPPFKFELVDGGDFSEAEEKGKLKVKSFSWYAIVFHFKHGLKDIDYILTNRYLVSLHLKNQFKEFGENCCIWDVYFSVVKDVSTFQNMVKVYAEDNDLECCTDSVTELTSDLKLSTALPPELKGWSVSCEVAISKQDVDRFIDGTPPLGKFKLEVKLDDDVKDFKHTFEIDGMHRPRQSLQFYLKKPNPAAVGGGGSCYDGPTPYPELLNTPLLKQKYCLLKGKILPHQRKFLQEELDDRHLPAISALLVSWKDSYDKLELEWNEVETIKQQHGTNVRQERIAAVNTWRGKPTDSSFDRLLCICISAEWKDGSDKIVKVMNSYVKQPVVKREVRPATPEASTSFGYGIILGVAAVAAVAAFAITKFRN